MSNNNNNAYALFPETVMIGTETQYMPAMTKFYLSNKVVALDIDGVLADLHRPWLQQYNDEFADDLTVDKIKSWDMDLYVKPSAKKAIYEYLNDPHLYDYVEPFYGAVRAVARLRELGFRVVFKTDATIKTAGRKYDWLNQHYFGTGADYVVPRDDYIECKDVSLIRADALLDDNHASIIKFVGFGVLQTRPWNIRYNWVNRVNTVDQFVDKVARWSQQQLN